MRPFYKNRSIIIRNAFCIVSVNVNVNDIDIDIDIDNTPSCVAAPGAPRDVIITWYNSTSVLLQWAPPRQTNGRVDFYQLQCYDSSISYTGLSAFYS